MDFFETLRSRRSIRSYSDREVEKDKLAALVEAVRLAPTAVNKQAFLVVIAPTSARREALLKAYGKAWFAEAPLAVAVFVDPASAWTRADGKSYADVDAAIVMDHFILAATALGLGTCWIGNFHPAATNEAFGLGPEWRPVALTPLGYAAEFPAPRPRKESGQIAAFH